MINFTFNVDDGADVPLLRHERQIILQKRKLKNQKD